MKKILVVGGTGMLGKPVVQALTKAGFEVTAMSRTPEKAKSILSEVEFTYGDVQKPDSLREALSGQDGLYINLATDYQEKERSFHPETDGLGNLLVAAKDMNLARVAMISSLVQYYEGFYWWVFNIKKEAVKLIRDSGLPYFIFYPTNFMESIPFKYRQGSKIYIIGTSKVKLYWIAGEDYGRQVANAFELNPSSSREYVVQGEKAMTIDEAIDVFVKNYSRESLKVSKMPKGLLKFASLFSGQAAYGLKISEALNNHPEKFGAEDTWKELGKPTITLEEFARNL